ncbi:MAG: Dihydroorotase [Sodalis sp.]|nr:MAG: Dihydroorotase [Sodalis sp.]
MPEFSTPRFPTGLHATVFEEIGALAHFEAFCLLTACTSNSPRFYGFPLNEDFITLRRETHHQPSTVPLADGDGEALVLFLTDQTLSWIVVDESGQ